MTEITVYKLVGTEPEPIAEWVDGEWAEGQEEGEALFPDGPPTQGELLETLDGPRVFASLPEDYDGPEDQKGIDEADHRDPSEVLDDPEEPTTNSLALKEGGDKVRIKNVHEAPPDKTVHRDEEGLFYVDEVDNPEPTEPEPPEEKAEEAVGLLERLRRAVADR